MHENNCESWATVVVKSLPVVITFTPSFRCWSQCKWPSRWCRRFVSHHLTHTFVHRPCLPFNWFFSQCPAANFAIPSISPISTLFSFRLTLIILIFSSLTSWSDLVSLKLFFHQHHSVWPILRSFLHPKDSLKKMKVVVVVASLVMIVVLLGWWWCGPPTNANGSLGSVSAQPVLDLKFSIFLSHLDITCEKKRCPPPSSKVGQPSAALSKQNGFYGTESTKLASQGDWKAFFLSRTGCQRK